MNYILYDRLDGTIVGSGATPFDNLESMSTEDMLAMEVPEIPGPGHKVVNGEVVEDGNHLTTAAERALLEERRRMKCSPMQGILALGETEWNKILTYRETATWQEKVIIDSAQDWYRNSENIAFFGYLLEYDDDQIDELFNIAMQIKA